MATTMICNIALLMSPRQLDKHMSLYSIQPQAHLPTTRSLVEGAALMLMHHPHGLSSAHQIQPPLSALIHSRQHCLIHVGNQCLMRKRCRQRLMVQSLAMHELQLLLSSSLQQKLLSIVFWSLLV